MRTRSLALVAFVLSAGTAQAQTQPPRVSLEWDYTAEWDATYPVGTLPGQTTVLPFIKDYRLEITRQGATVPTITTVVPRAQVTRTSGTLRVDNVPVLLGPMTLTLKAMSEEGQVSGPSNAVPFLGQGSVPTAPATLRLSAVK